MANLKWEAITLARNENQQDPVVSRAKVLGGWLIFAHGTASGLTFLPDPSHKWDGGSPQ
jgi:hypothetical protein